MARSGGGERVSSPLIDSLYWVHLRVPRICPAHPFVLANATKTIGHIFGYNGLVELASATSRVAKPSPSPLLP